MPDYSALQKTPREIHQELQRELKMRQDVYPRWVPAKKLTQQQADHRIACIQDMIKVMEIFFPEIHQKHQTTLEL